MRETVQKLSLDSQCDPIRKLYRTVPDWQAILAAVEAGRAEFANTLARIGLSGLGCSTSAVHPDDDIELHAFILGIVSAGRPEEIQTKAFLTYASHWIDDFFDNPDKVPDPDQLFADRRDIRLALRNMGPIGEVGFAMARRAVHPEAIDKTLHRMLYGGLVQRSICRAQRQDLVQEYLEVGTRFVDPALAGKIREVQPEAYWTTNKSVLEISYAAERDLDFTVAELWNLLYSSALYYQDVEEERARGELNFDDDEAPRLTEMLRMVRMGAAHLAPLYERESPHMRQLEFLALAIPQLPAEVAQEYRSLALGTALSEPPFAEAAALKDIGSFASRPAA